MWGRMWTVGELETGVLACETAVTVTVVGTLLPLPSDSVGTAPGATKRPELEINPVAWLPPATVFTCQVTAVFVVPVTAAVNCCVAKLLTVGVAGVTVTLTC